jgi:hypothetical protein
MYFQDFILCIRIVHVCMYVCMYVFSGFCTVHQNCTYIHKHVPAHIHVYSILRASEADKDAHNPRGLICTCIHPSIHTCIHAWSCSQIYTFMYTQTHTCLLGTYQCTQKILWMLICRCIHIYKHAFGVPIRTIILYIYIYIYIYAYKCMIHTYTIHT